MTGKKKKVAMEMIDKWVKLDKINPYLSLTGMDSKRAVTRVKLGFLTVIFVRFL